MKERNTAILILFLLGVLLSAMVYGTFLAPTSSSEEIIYSQEPLEHDINAVLPYKNLYIGDMNNFSNLLKDLPMSDLLDGCSLDLETLIVTVNYPYTTQLPQDYLQRALVYNAVASFCLIDNLEGICFKTEEEAYLFDRVTIEEMFGDSLKLLLNNWEAGFRDRLADQEFVGNLFNQASAISLDELNAADQKGNES